MKEKIIAFSIANTTIVLSLLTAYVYFCAYFYELGSCIFYHIPIFLIDVQIIDVIKFGASISGIIIFALFQLEGHAFNTISILHKSMPRIIFQFNAIILILISTLNNVINLPRITYLYLFAGTLLLNIPYYFIIRKVLNKKKNLLETYKIKHPDLSQDSLIKKLENDNRLYKNHLRQSIEYMFYLGSGIPLIIMGLGYGVETKQSSFFALKDNPTHVIVKKYGDIIICKDLTIKNELGDSLFVFKISAEKPLNAFYKVIKK